MQKIKKFIKAFIKEIKSHQSIVIFHHVRPDGDCLGTQQALKIWLKSKFPKKQIYAIGSSEGLFQFLNFSFDELPNDEILSKSLGIVVDANNLDRITFNHIISNKKIKTLIRIDHHPVEDDIDYKLRFVDSSYCASAEQLSHIIEIVDRKITNPELARFLYLGIYTDSGRFFYDYTSARTHRLVSFLFSSGFDFFQLHKDLSQRTLKELEFNKFVLNNYKTYKNVIYFYISQDDVIKLGLDDIATNRVDFLANIEGYDIWIFFIENSDKSIRVRLRSSDKDISVIANQFNGGGHKKAAGAVISSAKDIDKIVKKASELK